MGEGVVPEWNGADTMTASPVVDTKPASTTAHIEEGRDAGTMAWRK